MSIVRYTNKKTGIVSLYESTSYYDPETKQSRPRRKYLGTEDPETGELIPSSGKRGRKKSEESKPAEKRKSSDSELKSRYDRLVEECLVKDEKIKKLEHENKKLKLCIQKLRDTADAMIKDADC